MAKTRRQSGKLPSPIKSVPIDEEDNLSDMESNLYFSESGTESDSGSDWENGHSRIARKRGKPLAKRIKPNGTAHTPKAKGKRGKSDLSLLPSMPLDILFEVFQLLWPKDLITLSRTSKGLRRTLMSKNSTSIWKASRVRCHGPECPPDFSEPQWANLLFGGSNCEACGTKGVKRIDFALRRRVCTMCLKRNLIYSSNFPRKFPDLEVTIMDLIPYTNTSGWAHGRASGSKFYWGPDIHDMATKLGAHQKDIHMRKVGARQALDDFKAGCIALVEQMQQHAITCRNWTEDMASRRDVEIAERKAIRYNAIKARFLQLGYLDVDLAQLLDWPEVGSEVELTDRIWGRIRPIIEPYVLERKAKRLATERRVLIGARMDILKSIYQGYKKTIVPAQWVYLPRPYDVCNFAEFGSLLHAEHDVQVTVASFAEPMQALPALITQWTERRKRELAEMLIAGGGLTIADLSSPSTSMPSTDTGSVQSSTGSNGIASPADIRSLDLATSVFRCTTECSNSHRTVSISATRNPLIAWDGAVAHGCIGYGALYRLEPSETRIAYCKQASAAAALLVVLAGLDIKVAIPADMDRLDLRFVCLNCPPNTHGGVFGRRSYSWRTSISHFITATPRNHTVPSWELLDSEATATIRQSEGSNPSYDDPSWTCNHCPVHLDNWQNRATVIEHVQSMHDITHPMDPADFFFYPGCTPKQYPPVVFPCPKIPPPAKPERPIQRKITRCKHCPADIRRLFTVDGVQQHIKAKHGVPAPALGRDYWDDE